MNIWTSLTTEEINALSDSNWNIKKNVIDKINNLIISTDYKIAPEGVKDLLDVLTRQLNLETNKQSKKIYVQTLGYIGQSLPSATAKKY